MQGFRAALGDNLVGVYLGGSLATGEFDPETSDVDLLVVMEKAITDSQLGTLRMLHERIRVDENQFGQPYEVYYIDRATVRLYAPGQRHVKAGIDEEFGWKAHRQNWVIERRIIREHGVVLCGPEPGELIDPVEDNDVREAARSELRIRIDDWAREWNDGVNPAPWIEKRAAQSFEVVTVCRALMTAETGELPSKPKAFEWGSRSLPAEWTALVHWAQEHRNDQTKGTERVPEIIRFVQWAAAKATE